MLRGAALRRGGAALRRGTWIAYGILCLGAIWLLLTASGSLKSLAGRIAPAVPPWVLLVAVVGIPLLGALCSLDLNIDWKIRIAALVTLLICVPLLPLAFNSHPLLVLIVSFTVFAEEYVIIPAINRRWLSQRG